jgi:hypothetical protein
MDGVNQTPEGSKYKQRQKERDKKGVVQLTDAA